MDKTLTEVMNEKYANRKDKKNIYGVGISDSEFVYYAIMYLLGDDWYVADPIGHTQVSEIALYEILEKYSKTYRKECRKNNPISIKDILRKIFC